MDRLIKTLNIEIHFLNFRTMKSRENKTFGKWTSFLINGKINYVLKSSLKVYGPHIGCLSNCGKLNLIEYVN